MERHEYLDYKNRFVALTDKLDQLTFAIQNTTDPATASVLRGDYRAAFQEREEIMEQLIEKAS